MHEVFIPLFSAHIAEKGKQRDPLLHFCQTFRWHDWQRVRLKWMTEMSIEMPLYRILLHRQTLNIWSNLSRKTNPVRQFVVESFCILQVVTYIRWCLDQDWLYICWGSSFSTLKSVETAQQPKQTAILEFTMNFMYDIKIHLINLYSVNRFCQDSNIDILSCTFM